MFLPDLYGKKGCQMTSRRDWRTCRRRPLRTSLAKFLRRGRQKIYQRLKLICNVYKSMPQSSQMR